MINNNQTDQKTHSVGDLRAESVPWLWKSLVAVMLHEVLVTGSVLG